MNITKQITRATSLAIGSLALAAGCTDSDETGNDAEGGSTYSLGGARAGGAKSTGGARPMGGAATTTFGTTSGHFGGTTARLSTAGGSDVGGSAPQSAGGWLSTSAGGTQNTNTGGTPVVVGGTSTGTTSATTAVAGATTGGTATGGTVTGVAGNVAAGAGGTAQTTTSAVAGNAGAAGAPSPRMSFFVTSDTNTSGDLGGLSGADARCQSLAATVGHGSGVWHAYLSADARPSNGNVAVNARDRIGMGPWYNANDRLLANNLTELHAMQGNPDLFVDERGRRIPGQWAGSPLPIEHDILTGSTAAGTVLSGFNCEGWTSNSAGIAAQVGHSDGIGPNMSTDPPYDSWNSSHANESCANTAPRGGSGRLYCFRVNQ